MGIVIDQEFSALIPPLTDEEYRQLEENCVKDGIRDALVVWPQEDGNEILIDGHNRWRISAAHAGIPFQTVAMNFKSREEAKVWIIKHQFGRRNLSPYDRSVLALRLKPIIATMARGRQAQAGRGEVVQKSAQAKTREELASIAGVSHDTIHKVEAIQNSGDRELIRQVRNGNTSINKAYNIVADKPPSKSTAQIKKEFVKNAQKEHDDFQNKKVVSMAEIRADKEAREVIADNLYMRLMRMGDRVSEVIVDNKEKSINISEASKEWSHEERQRILDKIGRIRTDLMLIAQEVIGD